MRVKEEAAPSWQEGIGVIQSPQVLGLEELCLERKHLWNCEGDGRLSVVELWKLDYHICIDAQLFKLLEIGRTRLAFRKFPFFDVDILCLPDCF